MKFQSPNLNPFRVALAAALLLLTLAAPESSARQEAGREPPGHDGPQVTVPLGAVDKEGRPVEGLRPEDLSVTVEGQPQKLDFYLRRAEEPLHVVIMLDASASQERVLPFARAGADRLVPALLARGGSNDAAVVSFTGEAEVVQGLTADPAAARRAIASVEFVPPSGYIPGGALILGAPPSDPALRVGSTAVWDALVHVCEKVFARAQGGRRAVVLVTDGVDTSSRLKPDKAVERLTREGVAVYVVGVGDEKNFDQVDKPALRRLTERTGGRALFPKEFMGVPAAFELVRGELLNSYALTFNAPAPRRDGKALKLRVELVNPELRRRGVQVAHPQGLFVGRPAGRE